ncbi:hypothetical protein ACIBIZ_01425 [Nonomuraea spiralis]|uniref:hypothetical protein n=1 Tax=Nonomuraea TaxID=83681 RepID=UPI000F778910|nr:hypothetical protein [Nonomuraea sp. WAC 01424]RSN14668.1 hypothetical protein DMB42_09350 [Nonomuraea sp. WAC 01424]
MIITASTQANAAAVVLFQYPMARNIALMIGTLVCNPGSIAAAAKVWEEVAVEPIKNQIIQLKQEIEEKGYWKGPAYVVFSDAVDTFTGQLETTESYFKSVGSGVDKIAGLYHFAVQVAFWVATVMTIVAGYQVVSYFFPGAGQVAARVTINSLLTSLGTALRGIVSKKVKSVAMLTGLVVAVNAMCAMMTSSIDKGRPKPDFASADLEYTNKSSTGVGTLQRKNGGMPSLNLPSGGGLLG